MKLYRLALVLLIGVLLVMPAAAHNGVDHITLHFTATVGDEMAMCGMSYAGIGADEAEISFSDFRFYVSNIHLLTADGESVPLELIQDEMWQFDDVALLDFEDGSATCSEIGNAALNGEIVGDAPEGEYVGITFDLGVPFALNHQDVTAAQSPLNVTAMFWSWQGGYKFVRVDILTDAAENNGYNVHLGSTGCDSVAGAIPPSEECTRPNITTITFDEFDFANDVIVFDLAALLQGVPLYDNTPMPPGCMSGTDDPDCPALFPNFGLSLEDGVCTDDTCSAQTLFRVSDMESVTLVGRSDMSGEMNMGSGMDMSGMDMSGHDHDESDHEEGESDG